jgi:hypothetical protein
MNLKAVRACLTVCSLIVVFQFAANAQQNSDPSKATLQASTERDGQHDFDFEIGRWKTHVSRLQHPLTGSRTWVEYDGTTVVRKLWNGRANLVELEVTGPAGHIEGMSLRLYNPTARQWSLNFASSGGGLLTQPTVGEFKNGRGEFYDQEKFNDRMILVRFVISDITANSCHFEQAFSDDGGHSWEVNWIATEYPNPRGLRTIELRIIRSQPCRLCVRAGRATRFRFRTRPLGYPLAAPRRPPRQFPYLGQI